MLFGAQIFGSMHGRRALLGYLWIDIFFRDGRGGGVCTIRPRTGATGARKSGFTKIGVGSQ